MWALIELKRLSGSIDLHVLNLACSCIVTFGHSGGFLPFKASMHNAVDSPRHCLIAFDLTRQWQRELGRTASGGIGMMIVIESIILAPLPLSSIPVLLAP